MGTAADLECIEVNLPGARRVRLTPGVLDTAAITAFTNGQCHAMAIALSRRLGRPPALLLSHQSPSPRVSWREMVTNGHVTSSVAAARWDHAVVRLAPDRFLDATGVRTLSELRHMFYVDGDVRCTSSPCASEPRAIVVSTSPEQLRELSRFRRGGLTPNVAAAELFVDAVLANYGRQHSTLRNSQG